MKKIFLLLTLGLMLTMTGCPGKTLEPGGAYNPIGGTPNKPLLVADQAYVLAYDAINSVFKFEQDNRVMLFKLSPDIKHTLDALRPKAKEIHLAWGRAHTAYLANPTPTGLSGLDSFASQMQALLAAAQAALPKN